MPLPLCRSFLLQPSGSGPGEVFLVLAHICAERTTELTTTVVIRVCAAFYYFRHRGPYRTNKSKWQSYLVCCVKPIWEVSYYYKDRKVVGDCRRPWEAACCAWLLADLSPSQQQTLSGRAVSVYTCICVHDNIPCRRLPHQADRRIPTLPGWQRVALL